MSETLWAISWISEDSQGEIPMGEYVSEENARGELAACKTELLAQCLNDDESSGKDNVMTRRACLAGTWKIWRKDENAAKLMDWRIQRDRRLLGNRKARRMNWK